MGGVALCDIRKLAVAPLWGGRALTGVPESKDTLKEARRRGLHRLPQRLARSFCPDFGSFGWI